MKTVQNIISAAFVFHSVGADGLHGQHLKTFVRRANLAGKTFISPQQSNAYARFILDGKLEDEQRERLGYATHVISRAKQAGKTPLEIWDGIQNSFGARSGQPMDLSDVDDVRLGILAFGAGVCSQDSEVTNCISEYVNRIVRGRSFAISRVLE